MRNEKLYCNACDREVRVMITDAPPTDGQATLRDEAVVCLEIGDRCNGHLCPIGAEAPSAMVRHMIESGIPLAGLRTVRALCPSCGLEGDMVLYGEGRASCTACGTTARWVVEHADAM